MQAAVDVSGRPYCVHTGEPDGAGVRHDRRRLPRLADPARLRDARLPRRRSRCTCGCSPAATRTTSSRRSSRRSPGRCATPSRSTRARPACRRTKGTPVSRRRASSSSTTGRATSAPPCARSSAPAPTVDGDRRPARGAGRPTASSCPASAPSRPAWPGCARSQRPRDHRPPAGRRPARCSASASACRCCSSRRRARRRDRGLRRVARRRRAAAGAGRAAHGLEHRRGRPTGSRLFAGVEDERFYFVHSYGVRDWTLRHQRPHPARRW